MTRQKHMIDDSFDMFCKTDDSGDEWLDWVQAEKFADDLIQRVLGISERVNGRDSTFLIEQELEKR